MEPHAAEKDTTVVDVPERSRFEIRTGDELVGFVFYNRKPGSIALVHTEIDPRYGGMGMGTRLIDAVLSSARDEGLIVLPFCPFVRSYIDEHPGFLPLVPAQERARFGLPVEE